MARLNWSDDKPNGDGLVEFRNHKTGESVWTFPEAIVWFRDGTRVVGSATTVEQRRR